MINLLPPEILTHCFFFLGEKDLCLCAPVCAQWNGLVKNQRIRELHDFCRTLQNLTPQLGKVSSAFTKSLQTASEANTDNYLENKARLLDEFFQEFSRNNLGHEKAGLQGTRGKILATLHVPESLCPSFYAALQRLIQEVLEKRNYIDLIGCGRKINPLFLRVLCGTITVNNSNKLSLKIFNFSLQDAEGDQMVEIVKLKKLRSLNLSNNAFSDQCKFKFKEAAKEPKIQVII